MEYLGGGHESIQSNSTYHNHGWMHVVDVCAGDGSVYS